MKVEKMMRRSGWQPFFLYLALVLLGIGSLYPFQVAALEQAVAEGGLELPLSVEWMGLISLFPTLLISCIALLAGHFLSGRVGLASLIYARFQRSDESMGEYKQPFLLAAGLGLGLGILFVGFDLWARQWLGFLEEVRPSLASLALGVLYGGIVEEVLMRWGLMTVLIFFFTQKGRKRHPGLYVAAILITALVFAFGHYPATRLLTEMTPLVWFRMLFLNGAGGVVYGWLYWKYHLEAAVCAHILTHVGMFIANLVLSGL